MDKDQVTVGQDKEVRAMQEQDAPDNGADAAPESTDDGPLHEERVSEVAAEQASEPTAERVSTAVPEQTTESAVDDSGTEDGKESDADSASLSDLKIGSTVQGKVRNIVDFGAFIDIGVGRDGLAHISSLKRAGIDKTVKVGDTIDVVVRRVDTERNRISLTVPRAERAVKASLEQIKIGSVVEGRIKRLVDFGAFVDIGAPTDGLLHVSQLPWGYVGHPSEVLHVGDQVQVRVLDVDPDRRRISLSMKGMGNDEEKEPEPHGQPQPSEEPAGGAPTAFEVAFQQALSQKRRGRHSRD